MSVALVLVPVIITWLFANKGMNKHEWIPALIFSSLVALLPLIGHAFHPFRKKDATQAMLLIPASHLEKYTYEFILKIIIVPTLFILLFPIISNTVVDILQYFKPNRKFVEFTYSIVFEPMKGSKEPFYLIIYLISFIVSFSFAGSIVFRKYPLVKTAIFLGIVVLIIIGYVYLVDEILNIERGINYAMSMVFDNNISSQRGFYIIQVLGIISTLTALSYGFFKLKEKEA